MRTETAREPLTIDQFIERHGITLTASKIPLVSWWEGDKGAQSWTCVLKCGSREMSTTFTKGSGLRVWRAARRMDMESFDRPKAWRAPLTSGKPYAPVERDSYGNRVGDGQAHAVTRRRAQLPWNPSKYDRDAFLAWTDPEPPTAAEVLDSLASDASSADQSFEDWCGDYGHNTDSRKAETTYNACREVMFNLRKLLGMRDFETLLNNVERM